MTATIWIASVSIPDGHELVTDLFPFATEADAEEFTRLVQDGDPDAYYVTDVYEIPLTPRDPKEAARAYLDNDNG